MQHWQGTCSLACITQLFGRVALNASFLVKSNRQASWRWIAGEGLDNLECKHVQNCSSNKLFNGTEWQQWFSTMDSDTRQTALLYSLVRSPSICSHCFCEGENEFFDIAQRSKGGVAFQHAAIFLIIYPNMPLIRAPDHASIFFPDCPSK